jgi:outer membrane protein assembly factor BamB
MAILKRSIPALLLLAALAHGQTNPRGDAAGTNEHKTKPLRSEPKIAWEIKTRYRDGGGMVILGNVLVTGNFNGNGGAFGYDTATGKVLWSLPGQLHGDPGSDGTYAYLINEAGSNQFVLRKVEPKSGKVLWSAKASSLGVNDAPPVIADGKVFVAFDNGENLQAYDAATGKLLWEHNKKFSLFGTSMAYAGGLLFVAGNPGGAAGLLTALDGATGRVAWSAPLKFPYGGPKGPAVSNGVVVVLVNTEILAFDAVTGAPRWQQKARRDLCFEPAISGGVVYAYSEEGIMGWDLASGNPVFNLAMKLPDKDDSVRMMIAGGVLYIAGAPPGSTEWKARGWLHAIDLAERRILWSHQCYRPSQYSADWTTRRYVISDGALYYENKSILVKLVN